MTKATRWPRLSQIIFFCALPSEIALHLLFRHDNFEIEQFSLSKSLLYYRLHDSFFTYIFKIVKKSVTHFKNLCFF